MPSQHRTTSEYGTRLSENIQSGKLPELGLQVSGLLMLCHEVRYHTFLDRHPPLRHPQPYAYTREAYDLAGQPDPNDRYHRRPPSHPYPPLPSSREYPYKPLLPVNKDALNLTTIPDRLPREEGISLLRRLYKTLRTERRARRPS